MCYGRGCSPTTRRTFPRVEGWPNPFSNIPGYKILCCEFQAIRRSSKSSLAPLPDGLFLCGNHIGTSSRTYSFADMHFVVIALVLAAVVGGRGLASTQHIGENATCLLDNVEKAGSKCLIVLARYQEQPRQLDWVLSLPHRHVVLNVGDDLPAKFCAYPLHANVGRESYQYLQYIEHNYHDARAFGAVTVFCQGHASHAQYDTSMLAKDLDLLCHHDSHMPDGFVWLGNMALDFYVGFTGEVG